MAKYMSKEEFCKLVEKTTWFVVKEIRPFTEQIINYSDIVQEFIVRFLKLYPRMKHYTDLHLRRIIIFRGKHEIWGLVRRHNHPGYNSPKNRARDFRRTVLHGVTENLEDSTVPEKVERRENLEFLHSLIARTTFTTRERSVLRLYLQGLTLKKIGDELGVSESRVCQVMARVKKKLRKGAKQWEHSNFQIL